MHVSWRPILALVGALALLPVAACDRKGPAERAGEKIDNAIDDVTHPNEGPLEKTGRKMGEAVDDVTD